MPILPKLFQKIAEERTLPNSFYEVTITLLPKPDKWKWSESHSVVSDSLWPHGLDSPWNSPGQNTGVGSLSFLQRIIFPTQGSNPGLQHCRWILYQLSHKGSPKIMEWVAYPFSSRSSWPRNPTGVFCIAGGIFTNWAIREACPDTWSNTILGVSVRVFWMKWPCEFRRFSNLWKASVV